MNTIFIDYDKNPFFKEREFVCKCKKCQNAYVYKELIDKLTIARENANTPFIITSGCRCPEHNSKVKGSQNSDHLASLEYYICCGVDIHCIDNTNRFLIIKSLLDAGINRIGLDKTFIHAGIDKRNKANKIWFY